jgi:hypothetical protein
MEFLTLVQLLVRWYPAAQRQMASHILFYIPMVLVLTAHVYNEIRQWISEDHVQYAQEPQARRFITMMTDVCCRSFVSRSTDRRHYLSR